MAVSASDGIEERLERFLTAAPAESRLDHIVDECVRAVVGGD